MLPLITGYQSQVYAAHQARYDCDDQEVGTESMFECEGYKKLSPPSHGWANTHANLKQYFPQSWSQYGHNQRHNTVFTVPRNAPKWLTNGAFWAAPLTGLDFQDVTRSLPSVAYNSESWGSTTSQYVGNAVGVSVVQGITYVQTGKREIWALDTATGQSIWRQEVSTAAGMGQALVQMVNGKLTVFAPVGDAAFTVQNAVNFATKKTHFRGANFAGLYAFDGLTGKLLWRYATQGAQRPTPIYLDDKLYVTTNSDRMSILDASSGTELGSFNNPGNGYSGLAAPNWLDTDDGRRLLVYGTIRPAQIIGVDVTDASAPTLAWSFAPTYATANAPGDTSIAVDPDLGLAFTTVFSNTGSSASPMFDLNLMAINVATGTLAWNRFMGQGDSPAGYKGSVPMIHQGVVYAGNTLDGSYQAYDAVTGGQLWSSDLSSAADPPGLKHRPRAASVYVDGRLIVVEGRYIHTLNPATGEVMNRFQNPGLLAVWGINQPVIIGKLAILSSISGWVFAVPLDFITGESGLTSIATTNLPSVAVSPLKPALFFDPEKLPQIAEAAQFDNTVLAYAGGQSHNSAAAAGPEDVDIEWLTALKDAIPLDENAHDEQLYGREIATHMTHIAVGASTGVSAAAGILYVGSDRFTVDAINAIDGELIWRQHTQNANFGQPLVTPDSVIVSSGDPWLNLGKTGQFRAGLPATSIGDNWASLRAYDRLTGKEKWTIYTASGTSAMTPLYNKGNLYWVNGQGKVWAVKADTGEPVAPFMHADGLPVLSLGGFNAISSANIYHQSSGDILLVGTAMPDKVSAIDLNTASVLWSQDLAATGTPYSTGFAAVSLAVTQAHGLVYGSVLVDADTVTNQATVLAYALDAVTGELRWSHPLATGAIPTGFVGPTPLIDRSHVFYHNPVASNITALDLITGTPIWQTAVSRPQGKLNWGPGVVVDSKLIQPVGGDLLTLDATTGMLINRYKVGGSFTYNHPSIVGNTLYIGNSWGWAMAIPTAKLIGNKAVAY